jgi:hypothetical protein
MREAKASRVDVANLSHSGKLGKVVASSIVAAGHARQGGDTLCALQ